MDPAKDEGGRPQPPGPPTRKKFVIPLEEDETPPAGAKPLFRSSRNPTTATPAQAAPQSYAEYAIAQPPGGAGATGSTGSEPVKGENPSQTLKTGAKSSSILVSPRQGRSRVSILPEDSSQAALPCYDPSLKSVFWVDSLAPLSPLLCQWVPTSACRGGAKDSGASGTWRPSTCPLPCLHSLRYHNLHPDYIHERLQGLGKTFALRVLLVQVDVKDPQQALKELAKMCILADCTLVLAWSAEEAGRYLETYKAYEQKPADLLMEKLEQNFLSRATECLTTVKSVNKTDSQTLLATFGSLEQLFTASREDLALCPGLGPQKARRLFDVLHEPFLKVPR
nr:DNA excision repair protein ERCC-1 [Peromyscus maniculatus bairdii]